MPSGQSDLDNCGDSIGSRESDDDRPSSDFEDDDDDTEIGFWSTDEDSSSSDDDVESHEDYDGESEEDEGCELDDVLKALGNWHLEYGSSRKATNALLQVLRTAGIKCPKDIRTIMRKLSKKITFDAKTFSCKDGGKFVYFGIENVLKLKHTNFFDKNCECIRLHMNVDGLPLYKSSPVEVWPILCHAGSPYEVFLVGFWCGNGKPQDIKEYLNEFVEEILKLYNTGIVINDKVYEFRLGRVIADAPAKAFLLRWIGHCGYDSCTKCTTHGERKENRMSFPDLDATLRKDDDFKNCPLSAIPGFSVTRQVVLDYLHLILLGVVKKLLKLMTKGGRRYRVFDRKTIDHISKKLKIIAEKFVPTEFQRKLRDLTNLKRWKGTELRQFILYTVWVITSELSHEGREHLLLLHCAVRLLCSDSTYSEPTRQPIRQCSPTPICEGYGFVVQYLFYNA